MSVFCKDCLNGKALTNEAAARGVEIGIFEVPTPRHPWSDIAVCPTCRRAWLVTRKKKAVCPPSPSDGIYHDRRGTCVAVVRGITCSFRFVVTECPSFGCYWRPYGAGVWCEDGTSDPELPDYNSERES